jgi:hypothetical protein
LPSWVARKLALLGLMLSAPLALLVAASVLSDPYRVFRPPADPLLTDWEPNTRYLKTEQLLRARGAPEAPNAFVFGGSAAGAFRDEDLRALVAPDLRFYNYFVSVESLEGIREKLAFLIDEGYDLRCVLLVLRGTPVTTEPTFLRREHPRVSGEPRWRFYGGYAAMLLQGFEESFLRVLRRALMPERSPRLLYRLRTGEVFHVDEEEAITRDGDGYYRRLHPDMLVRPRPDRDVWTLSPAHRSELVRIAELLRRTGCPSVHLLLAAGFRPYEVDPGSESFLRDTFEHVHVFAGDHAVPSDPRNYYDPTHYRPEVARWMLSRMNLRGDASPRAARAATAS